MLKTGDRGRLKGGQGSQQQVVALGRLGSPLRRIETETGVRSRPAAAGKSGERDVPAPGSTAVPDRVPTATACELCHDFIDVALSKGRSAKAIYPDLVGYNGFTDRYESVRRFVRQLYDRVCPEACGVIVPRPGKRPKWITVTAVPPCRVRKRTINAAIVMSFRVARQAEALAVGRAPSPTVGFCHAYGIISHPRGTPTIRPTGDV